MKRISILLIFPTLTTIAPTIANAGTFNELSSKIEKQLTHCLENIQFAAEFSTCLEAAEKDYLNFANSQNPPTTIPSLRYNSILKACDQLIQDPAEYAEQSICRLEIARSFASRTEVSYLEMLHLRAEAISSPQSNHTSTTSQSIPWTLYIEGYGPGECTQNDLAIDWNAAKNWAKNSLLPIESVYFQETEEALTFKYYDATLQKNAIRIFYKNMETCKTKNAQQRH